MNISTQIFKRLAESDYNNSNVGIVIMGLKRKFEPPIVTS